MPVADDRGHRRDRGVAARDRRQRLRDRRSGAPLGGHDQGQGAYRHHAACDPALHDGRGGGATGFATTSRRSPRRSARRSAASPISIPTIAAAATASSVRRSASTARATPRHSRGDARQRQELRAHRHGGRETDARTAEGERLRALHHGARAGLGRLSTRITFTSILRSGAAATASANGRCAMPPTSIPLPRERPADARRASLDESSACPNRLPDD